MEKNLYVSPFLEMDLTYRFRVDPPATTVRVGIRCDDDNGPILTASLSGKRREISDVALAKVFLSHPLLTMKVMAGIHWEALRLWLKGVKLHNRPPPPDHSVTVVPRHS